MIGVEGNVGAPVGCGIGRRLHLLEGELGSRERIRGRGVSATRSQLDLGRPVPEVLTDRSEDVWHTIDDPRIVEAHPVQLIAAELRIVLIREPEVAMPGRLADHGTGRIDARPRHAPLVDRLLQTEDAASHVPDRGHAAHQHVLGITHRVDEGVAGVAGEQGGLRQGRETDVDMRVGQARHEGPPAAVDHRGASGRDRVGGDLLDQVPLDQHIGVLDALLVHAVEHVHVREQHLRGRRLLCHRGRGFSGGQHGQDQELLHGSSSSTILERQNRSECHKTCYLSAFL